MLVNKRKVQVWLCRRTVCVASTGAVLAGYGQVVIMVVKFPDPLDRGTRLWVWALGRHTGAGYGQVVSLGRQTGATSAIPPNCGEHASKRLLLLRVYTNTNTNAKANTNTNMIVKSTQARGCHPGKSLFTAFAGQKFFLPKRQQTAKAQYTAPDPFHCSQTGPKGRQLIPQKFFYTGTACSACDKYKVCVN